MYVTFKIQYTLSNLYFHVELTCFLDFSVLIRTQYTTGIVQKKVYYLYNIIIKKQFQNKKKIFNTFSVTWQFWHVIAQLEKLTFILPLSTNTGAVHLSTWVTGTSRDDGPAHKAFLWSQSAVFCWFILYDSETRAESSLLTRQRWRNTNILTAWELWVQGYLNMKIHLGITITIKILLKCCE